MLFAGQKRRPGEVLSPEAGPSKPKASRKRAAEAVLESDAKRQRSVPSTSLSVAKTKQDKRKNSLTSNGTEAEASTKTPQAAPPAATARSTKRRRDEEDDGERAQKKKKTTGTSQMPTASSSGSVQVPESQLASSSNAAPTSFTMPILATNTFVYEYNNDYGRYGGGQRIEGDL